MPAPSAAQLPSHLILALDGIPFDVFQNLQRQGSFQGFAPVRRMVSPFPSLTDVAFSTIAGSDPPSGYQVVRFDSERNRVVGNSLRSLSGRAHAYLPADTRPRSIANRLFSYLTPCLATRRQLQRMRKDFLRSKRQTFVAYIEATDAVLHVRGRRAAERLLMEVDLLLEDLVEEVYRQTGRNLAIDIVSDHGSTAGGGRRVQMEKALEQCGFRRQGRLKRSRDVSYTQAGIIGYVALSCDPDRTESVARCVLSEPGVDLVSFVREGSVVVMSKVGEAEILALPGDEERYSYQMLSGDPLGLMPILEDRVSNRRLVALEEDLFRRTILHKYPDPLRRLWRSFHGLVQDPSEVLVSLKDGYESSNAFVRGVAALVGREGTHGSLTGPASLGLIVSNWRDLEDTDAWRARELLFGAPAE